MFAKPSFSAAAGASAVFLLAGAVTGVSASPVQSADVTITVRQPPFLWLLSKLTSQPDRTFFGCKNLVSQT
jgi:hypothetical protein